MKTNYHLFSSLLSKAKSRPSGILLLLASSALSCLGSGCAGLVPQTVTTRIHYDRAAGELLITSPKDVTIGSLETVRAPDGSLTVNLIDYAATANAAAIAGAQHEAASRAQLLSLLAQTIPAALGRAITPLPTPREPTTRAVPADDEGRPPN